MKIAYRLFFVILISMMFVGCGEKTASIEGNIVDGKGKPVPGVSVIFKQVQPTQGYEQFETKTGADGVFKLSGLAPVSDYVISILSDKWKTKVTKKIKTLEAGQILTLSEPIKVRFNQLKDGTIVDTKTSLQWYIHPALDITAGNVLSTVKGLNIGGFKDWRLPLRAEINDLQVKQLPAKKPTTEPALVNKTCCAWVSIGDKSESVDWKFYIEEDNELWASSKESPDNRIVIVRNMMTTPVAKTTVIPPSTVEDAKATPVTPSGKEQVSSAAKSEMPSDKLPEGIRKVSRKACAEKRVQLAKLKKTAPDASSSPSQTPSSSNVAGSIKNDSAKVVPAKVKAPGSIQAPVKNSETSLSQLSESIYFEPGSSTLTTLQLAKLKAFALKLKGKIGVLLIDGHSDSSSGNKSSNLILSLERSSKVVTTLNNMGLGNSLKMEVKASGDAKPLASDDTPEGRSLNRRVDISYIPE